MTRQTNRVSTTRTSGCVTRSPPDHLERAFISAARRNDRSREARMRSALRASSIHFQNSGFYFNITPTIVMEGVEFGDLDELQQLYNPELVLPDGITPEDVLRRTPFLRRQQVHHGSGGSLGNHNSLTTSVQFTDTAPVAAPVEDVLPTKPPHNSHFMPPEEPSQPDIHFPSPLPQNMPINPTYTYQDGFFIPDHPGRAIYAVQNNLLVPIHPSMLQLAMDPLNHALFAAAGMEALALMQATNNALPHHQEAAGTPTSNEPIAEQYLAEPLDLSTPHQGEESETSDGDMEAQSLPKQDKLP